jgi:hypothetical protein
VARRVQEAEATLAGLGLRADHGTVPATAPNRVERAGDLWHITFGGRRSSVRHSKGMADLALLLARPGRQVAALVLMAPDGRVDAADLGDALDEQARSAYRRRLAQLESDAAAADLAGDAAWSERIHGERQALLGQLAGAFGLGGRPRRSGGSAERARTAVTARIRDAIRRVGRVDDALARHLERAVRTGSSCSYEPEADVRWELGRREPDVPS